MSEPPTAVVVPLEYPLEEPSALQRASRCSSCCWTALRFLNSFAVAILAGVTVFLFFQVQYLTVVVTQEQQQLDSLTTKLANQTQGQIQELTEKVNQEHTLTLYQMAGTFALLACLLTSFHMYAHLRNYKEPLVQRKIVTILWLSPIYAVTSFLSLVFPVANEYLAVIKDFYEAYAIYTFVSFLIAVLGRGDRQVAVQVLSRHAEHLAEPTRCLSSCYHPPPSVSGLAKASAVVTECQILAMQFVFIRPLTSIIGFVSNVLLSYSDRQEDLDDESSHTFQYADILKSPSFYLSVVQNISVFLAFAGLLKFYHAVRDDLAWCQPFSKFMTIKSIVFLTFWQGVLIDVFVSLNAKSTSSTAQHDGNVKAAFSSSTSSSSDFEREGAMQQAAQIQNFLICLEMLFFSIAHYCVFPVEEWEPGYRPTAVEKPGIGLKDFVSDMSYIISSRRGAGAGKRGQQVPTFDSDLDFDDDGCIHYEHDGRDENLEELENGRTQSPDPPLRRRSGSCPSSPTVADTVIPDTSLVGPTVPPLPSYQHSGHLRLQ